MHAAGIESQYQQVVARAVQCALSCGALDELTQAKSHVHRAVLSCCQGTAKFVAIKVATAVSTARACCDRVTCLRPKVVEQSPAINLGRGTCFPRPPGSDRRGCTVPFLVFNSSCLTATSASTKPYSVIEVPTGIVRAPGVTNCRAERPLQSLADRLRTLHPHTLRKEAHQSLAQTNQQPLNHSDYILTTHPATSSLIWLWLGEAPLELLLRNVFPLRDTKYA